MSTWYGDGADWENLGTGDTNPGTPPAAFMPFPYDFPEG